MTVDISQVYDRSRPDDHVESVLIRADRISQSAELNEIQSNLRRRIAGIADALFKDGDIVRDAACRVSADTGRCDLDAGALYLAGAVRGVPSAQLTVPTVGTVTVGVYLPEIVQSELENPGLLNPAVGTRGYGEPGALRLLRVPRWGVAGASADPFYPVYQIDDGVLRAKEPPPNLDAVTQALARYDIDSAGGMYITSGLELRLVPGATAEQQVYTLTAGRARVRGFGVELRTDRRLVYSPAPDMRAIIGEPHLSATAGQQRIMLDRAPAARIDRVKITAEKTVDIVHGMVIGASDALPDASVLEIVSIKQGATPFAPGADYRLTAGMVDWSAAGAEPATGSTYRITYRYIAAVQPSASDATSVTLSGAVPGTLVEIDYQAMLPRIDRLCLTADGELSWLRGVAADRDPAPPPVPDHLLLLASVDQRWHRTDVIKDGVVMVPMRDIAAVSDRLDRHATMLSQLQLETSINAREAQAKRGMQVDPFLTDEVRDQGLPQTAAVFGGICTLPITADADYPAADIAAPATLAYELVPIIEQPWITGSMRINPYLAFDQRLAQARLIQAVDRWAELVATVWSSPVTEIFGTPRQDQELVTRDRLVMRTASEDRVMPARAVRFELHGFAPGEALAQVFFDGRVIAPEAS